MNDETKDSPEFTDEQLREALKRVGKAVRERAFAAGRPVVVVRGEWIVERYADGTEKRVERLRPMSDTSVKE